MPNKVISRPSIGVFLTQTQLDILRQLYEAGVGVFVKLRLHRNTHLKFFVDGWVLYSADVKRTDAQVKALKSQPPAYYALTPKGAEIYRAFCTGYRRMDGICPRCDERPRLSANRYCRECESKIKRVRRVKPGLCPCGQPRHQSRTGRYYQRCADCIKRYNADQYRLRHAARVAAQAAGTPIICAMPGCNNPCYISPSGQSSKMTCAACANAITRKSNRLHYRRRVAQRMAQRLQQIRSLGVSK